MSKWVSTIRRACDALFLYELKGYRFVLFGWCHDPPRTPRSGHPNRCPNRISGPLTRTPDPDGFVPTRPVRFPGISRCLNVPETPETQKPDQTSNCRTFQAIENIGDWKKLEILVQNQSFWNIVTARPTAAPRNSGRDNAAGIMIIWWTSPPLILQIHSLHQVATGTPFHVPLRRRGIIITIFHGFGTKCMVLYRWDSAPRCVCRPISYLI